MLATGEASGFAFAIRGANVGDGYFEFFGDSLGNSLFGRGFRHEEDIGAASLRDIGFFGGAWE